MKGHTMGNPTKKWDNRFTRFWILWVFFALFAFSPAHADQNKATSPQPAKTEATLKWVAEDDESSEKQTLQWVTDESNTPTASPISQDGQTPKNALPKKQQTKPKPDAKEQARLKEERARKERILDYDVSAVVEKDASMTVTERITVNVENVKIRHGITRTYPIKMRDGEDGVYNFGFKLISTKLDDEPVDCKSQEKGLMVGMALGSAKTTVSPGIHTYEIVYKTTGHVRSLDEHDEIYYNAIGLDVIFPIEKATFSLTLPDGTKPILTKAYTGKSGERGEDYRMTGNMVFETTRRLAPKEGFTVVVGWPKGVVTIPERGWLSNHRNEALLIVLGVVVAVLIIGWLIQFWHHRPTGAYPIFTPPDDWTPGKFAFINKEKYTPLMLQADLIWTAIKGYCRMNCNNPEHTVFNWANKDNMDEPLQPGSKKKKRSSKAAKTLSGTIANTLFSAVDKIILGYESAKSKRPHNTLSSAWNNLYNYYKTRLFDKTKTKFATPIWALGLGCFALICILDGIWHPGLLLDLSDFDMIWFPGIFAGGGMFLVIVLKFAWDIYRDEKLTLIVVGGIILALIAVAFIILA
ncbi:MAG: DUF2207 domain-containing protein, partial [Oxalobacter sp.]|nr:DUF2207 domain-containing protein [Oxalobacter sp.]